MQTCLCWLAVLSTVAVASSAPAQVSNTPGTLPRPATAPQQIAPNAPSADSPLPPLAPATTDDPQDSTAPPPAVEEEVIPPPPSAAESAQDRAAAAREAAMAAAARRFGAFSPIGEVTIETAPESALPEMYAFAEQDRPEVQYVSPPLVRPWENLVLRPHDSFCHRPLYFDESNLERYGVSRGWAQPACSAAHFFGGVAMLPYKMSVKHPCRCYYYQHPYLAGVDGFERRQPLRRGPALIEAATVTGLVFLLP